MCIQIVSVPSGTVKNFSTSSILQRLPSTTSTPSGINLMALSPGKANALTLSPLAISCLQT